jgi:hypothetical protein
LFFQTTHNSQPVFKTMVSAQLAKTLPMTTKSETGDWILSTPWVKCRVPGAGFWVRDWMDKQITKQDLSKYIHHFHIGRFNFCCSVAKMSKTGWHPVTPHCGTSTVLKNGSSYFIGPVGRYSQGKHFKGGKMEGWEYEAPCSGIMSKEQRPYSK